LEMDMKRRKRRDCVGGGKGQTIYTMFVNNSMCLLGKVNISCVICACE